MSRYYYLQKRGKEWWHGIGGGGGGGHGMGEGGGVVLGFYSMNGWFDYTSLDIEGLTTLLS